MHPDFRAGATSEVSSVNILKIILYPIKIHPNFCYVVCSIVTSLVTSWHGSIPASHPTSLGRGAALYMTTSTEPLLVAKVCNKWRASGHLLPFLGAAKQQLSSILDFKCLVRQVQVIQVFLESNQGILNVGEESFWTYWMRPNATSKAKMPQFTLLADSSTHSMPVSNSTARPKCLTCAYCCTVGKIIGFYLLILA